MLRNVTDTTQKMKFSQEIADLDTSSEEILNGKLHFLCIEKSDSVEHLQAACSQIIVGKYPVFCIAGEIFLHLKLFHREKGNIKQNSIIIFFSLFFFFVFSSFGSMVSTSLQLVFKVFFWIIVLMLVRSIKIERNICMEQNYDTTTMLDISSKLTIIQIFIIIIQTNFKYSYRGFINELWSYFPS